MSKLKKKLGWVPNTLTLGNLTMGFTSMLICSEVHLSSDPAGLFSLAGFFIILAALFDGFDGMAARALDATSELGADLDSLADLTTFGIAPGFLMYKMVLEKYKLDVFDQEQFFPIGMLIAAIFPICAAYRLARFNVAHDPSSFTGLPSPVAGVVVGFFPFAFPWNSLPNILAVLGFVLVALLMVSTIRYGKPQSALRGKFSWPKFGGMIVGLVVLFSLIGMSRWPLVLYGVVFFYIFGGILAYLLHKIQEWKL